MSRTRNTLRNLKYSIIGQATDLILAFISRTFFIRVLSAEYLGINGTFSGILNVLSLAELGVGTAITYSLYRPISAGDREQITAIMQLFRRWYIGVGLCIFLAGLALTPLLHFIIGDISSDLNIKIVFLLFVFNSAVSYFFSYKRNLITAYQSQYIVSKYQYIAVDVEYCIQIAVLAATRNYYLFLLVQTAVTVATNVLISSRADALFPELNRREKVRLDDQIKFTINKNIKASFLQKIGEKVIGGTDNVIISKFVGVSVVGIYSNYTLIVGAVNKTYGMIYGAMLASIGNLGASERRENIEKVFYKICFCGSWMAGFGFVCLVGMFNPFIELWLGMEYLLPPPVVLIIGVNFYVNAMRRPLDAFHSALGLYWYDRYKPLIETVINLFLSILLVTKMRIAGVLIGTFVSSVLMGIGVEPYIVCKYGIHKKADRYYREYILCLIWTVLSVSLTIWLCRTIEMKTPIQGVVLRVICCIVIPNLLFYLLFRPRVKQITAEILMRRK